MKADRTVNARWSRFMYGGEKNEFPFFLQIDGAVDTVAVDDIIDMQYPAYNISSFLHTKNNI